MADPKSPILDDGLVVGAAPAPALDPTRPEEAFIDLDDSEQRASRFAVKQDALPIHGVAV